MSTLFAYIGKSSAKEILLSGISNLKYQKKDMSGIVVKEKDCFSEIKAKGAPIELKSKVKHLKSSSAIGLAEISQEIRFKASAIAAPPSSNNLFAVALDGDIENFGTLKKYCSEPFPIISNEDLALAFLCTAKEKSRIEAAAKLAAFLPKETGFAFIPCDEEAIYCKSGISKLVIGTSQNGSFVSSELGAILPFCEKFAILESGEIAKLTKDKILISDCRQKRIKKTFQPVSSALASIGFSPYAETNRIPLAIKETVCRFVETRKINFDYLKLKKKYINKINKIIIVGSDYSKATATAAKSLFETYCSVNCDALECVEFLCSSAPLDKNTLVIIICESGEGKNAIKCANKAEKQSAKTIALTSNKTSSLARECNYLICPNERYFNLDTAIGCFLSDYLALCLFALYLGDRMGIISELYMGVSVKMAEMLFGIVSSATKGSPSLSAAANSLSLAENIYVCSVGNDFSLADEAAQKMRAILKKKVYSLSPFEISELPEGIISASTVFALLTNNESYHSALSAVHRAQSRGASVIILTSETVEEELIGFENIISFNDSLAVFNPLPCIASVYKIALLANGKDRSNDVVQSA